jgi:hypothetical protein
MPHKQRPAAEIIEFPKVPPRTVRFSRQERQAILALSYALPGTDVSFGCRDEGDERCTIEARDGDGTPWWVIVRTRDGFDVTSANGCHIKCFTSVEPLVERMKAAMACMLNLLVLRDSAQVAPRTLNVV